MKVNTLGMSSKCCTYMHFLHTEHISKDKPISSNKFTEEPIGIDESKTYICTLSISSTSVLYRSYQRGYTYFFKEIHRRVY